MRYFLFDQYDDDGGLFKIRLIQNQFKNDIGLREMEKGGPTIQPW